MTDPRVVFKDLRRRLEFCELHIVEANYWLTFGLNGHPRAQDFEPTGHGGSDPTAVAGTLGGDRAAAIGKEMRRRQKRIFEDTCWLEARIAENLHAERPKFDPEDPEEYCRNHLQLDEYVYRYRGDKCRPCYERTLWLRDNRFDDTISVDELRYHKARGRWPSKARDSKQPPPMKQPPPSPLSAVEAARVLSSGGHIANTDALKLNMGEM